MTVDLTGDSPPLDPSLLPRTAVIAIDGPAGSGKSTTARALADIFGLLYIDSGAMYRALTQAALSKGIDPGDEDALAAILVPANLVLKPSKGEVSVFWNGKDVSLAIRTPEVDATVSRVSSHAAVRANMVERQKVMGRLGGVVMEGRDIGTVVFPLATAKIFLSASLDARIERRFRQYQQRGLDVSREELRQDLAERDRQDSERQTSPLTISPDSIVIDSSELSLEQQNQMCARACLVNPTLDLELDTDLETAIREIPWHYRLAYSFFNASARFFGLRQVGNEGGALPRGCILAVNHVSNWDPPLIGSTFHRYPVHALAKAELFKFWPLGPIFRWIDSIPIQRSGFDAEAFREAAARLADGANLLIFPEGTRRAIGHPGPVRNGLGILVQATGAPTLPLFIRGSYGRQPGGSPKSPLEVHFGPVIRWHGVQALLRDHDKKEVSLRIGNLCEAAFRELQARSFAAYPETEYEKELGARQLKKFARRQEQVFRN
ncbi:MAG: (d)CMP kinase [Candidatus Krumholzibacteria bacterium]|nr:(d)CMP kinase [Candidatus Krumholzibacteria bacterium]